MSRKLLLALLAAGLCVTAAWADDDDDEVKTPGWRPTWTAWAPREKLRAAFPKEAKETGRARLDCVAAKDGRLVDCKIAKEIPAGQGFGAAALKMVGYERIQTKDETGASVEGRPVHTWLSFLAPGDADPDWLRKPSENDLAAVFPKRALSTGQGGQAMINCRVTVEGFLEACKVVSEKPADYGFGSAALQLSPQLRMSPRIRGGKPVPGGQVTVPVIWPSVPASFVSASGPSLVLDPPWTRAPTQAEINAAWPKEAAGLSSGQAALRCEIDATGHLKACSVISEIPHNKGFGKAAKSVSKAFAVSFDPADVKVLKKVIVDVPFRFRDPAAPDGRKLTKPRWTESLSPEGMAAVYPEAAIKAGVKAGKGAATCVVSAEGRLAHCQAAREAPAGLDFGAAAVKAASVMRMNPWTKEGDTVEGLTITIPFEFTWSEPEPAPAKR